MNTVKIQNTSKSDVAITGYPLIAAGETIEVTAEQAEYLTLNDSLSLVEKSSRPQRASSFKAIDPE